MNFLGIGSGELILILVIAVLVVGPEKMVELATKLGMMVARIRHMTNDATKEFRDALAIDEVKEAIEGIKDEVKDINQELKGTAKDVRTIETDAAAAAQEFKTVAEGGTVAPAAPAPKPGTGKIPKAVLDRLGPPPAKPGDAAADSQSTAEQGSQTEDDADAPPVDIGATTVIEKEDDLEPIELGDVQVHDADGETAKHTEESPGMSKSKGLQDRELSLMEHFVELRKRLMIAFIALVVTTGFCMAFAERGLQLLIRPMGDVIPQTIGVTESFVVYFKVAFIGGVALAMPVIVYELVRFLLPGLLPHERKYLYFLIPGVFLCFILGISFAALIMLPAAINFMQGFLVTVVENRWTLDNYVSFVTRVMFWMGIVFQMPLILFFLAKLGLVTPKSLAKFRKWAFLLTSVIAAMVTPTPDPVNMMIVMVPLYLLYEVGVLLTRLAKPRRPQIAET